MDCESVKKGFYGKYIIKKADGSPIDAHACYFILRLDTDQAARSAMREYARHCDSEDLAVDITRCLDALDRGPCSCRSVGECWHDFWGGSIWEHGGDQT